MGPFDRQILDFVDTFENDCCSIQNLLEYTNKIQDYDVDRAINDIQNLVNDGLLVIDEESKTIRLADKAKKPVVPLPKNQN